jgi:intracellular septation protein
MRAPRFRSRNSVKLLFDFFPVILFFIAFKLSDIFVATGVAIAATVLQIGWVLVRRKKVSNMQWMSLVIIVLFGGATLVLHDETFIKWKPTVLYWLAATAFLVGLAFRTNLIKALMAEGLTLPEPIWTRLCVAWGVFFLFTGALNLWVAYNFSTAAWVNFKLFGGFGLIFAFVIAQALWLSKYVQEEPAKAAEPPRAEG